MTADVVFLFDVDNTLFDNDAFQHDLKAHLQIAYGDQAGRRYWALFDELWAKLGYADYLGALELWRLEEPHNPKLLRLARWLLDYPFADGLYPDISQAIGHAKRRGPVVILSDGDAVFQPWKIHRSGLESAFEDNVLVYVHKQNELDAIEQAHPAKHYVFIDDKLAILDAVKKVWGDRVTTIFPRQGHYAFDAAILAKYAPADFAIDRIADFAKFDI